MSTKSKKGSVFLQGWVVFMLFIHVSIQYSLSHYWQNQALISLQDAKNTVNEHIKVIQDLRQIAQKCTQEDECETQTSTTSRFHYWIRFDTTHYNVVEIIITKH